VAGIGQKNRQADKNIIRLSQNYAIPWYIIDHARMMTTVRLA
jgi:hypothetical protein